jgi:hypothetical protein
MSFLHNKTGQGPHFLVKNWQSRREGNELGVFSFRTCVFLTLRDELPTEMSRALGPPHPNGFVSNPSIVCPARPNLLHKRKKTVYLFSLTMFFLEYVVPKKSCSAQGPFGPSPIGPGRVPGPWVLLFVVWLFSAKNLRFQIRKSQI